MWRIVLIVLFAHLVWPHATNITQPPRTQPGAYAEKEGAVIVLKPRKMELGIILDDGAPI